MFDLLKKTLVITLAVLTLFFLYTHFFGPIPFAVNSITTTKSNLFQASGEGQVSAIPDSAEVVFGVTKTTNTVADAQNQTNSAIASITDALKKFGIQEKDMKTTNYSVSPNYDFRSGTQTVTGYTVTQQIDLKLQPLDKANKAIDTITANGANIINGVTFTFSDDLKQTLEDKARQMAVTDAKRKAESLAKAAGIHLGKVVDVQENSTTPQPIPFAGLNALKEAGSGAPTQVTPGENNVNITVTVSYETY